MRIYAEYPNPIRCLVVKGAWSIARMVAGLTVVLVGCARSVTREGSGGNGAASNCSPSSSTPSYAPDSATKHCARGPQPGVCPAPGQPAYGQDGNYSIRVPSYSVSGDIVTDSITGLSWQRTTSATEVPWEQAAAVCSSLALGGYSDWRLPTRLELVTIFDYGQAVALAPPFETSTAPGTVYWSTSVHGAQGTAGSTVSPRGDVADGYEGGGLGWVRCVRGMVPPGGYVPQGGGATVLDQRTGLEWQRDVSSVPRMEWADALRFCNGLHLTGGCGWRVPTVKELETIVEDTAVAPPIDTTAFPATPPEPFWTSTIVVASAGEFDNWAVLFDNELTAVIPYQAGTAVPFAGGTLRVRCVR